LEAEYPAASIVAFEPDPTIFAALEWNCRQWDLTGVELINRAVWTQAGEMSFWPEGSDSGRLLPRNESEVPSRITVETVCLRDFLNRPIDLLKLDIEGAEVDVLIDCADHLNQVDHLFMDYHSFVGQPQRLDDLLRVLRSAGFRFYLQPEVFLPSPFVQRRNHRGMDQTLNVFAYRDR
jgi:FkbM family methyltransferase